jgi:hypothetical protein
MCIDKLARLVLSAGENYKNALEAVEQEVLSLHKQFKEEIYEAQSELILSLWSKRAKKRTLLHIADGIVSSAEQMCIGTGRSVAQPMISELISRSMSMKEIGLMALYMLAEAKMHTDGCGKESQIVCLGDGGGWELFPSDPDYPSIREIEDSYFKFKRLLFPLLLTYGDLPISQSDFEGRLNAFKEASLNQRRLIASAYYESVEARAQRQLDDYLEQAENQDEDLTPPDEPSSLTNEP